MSAEMAKKNQVEKKWWLVDAQNQVLGRLATRVADLLRGKHKSIFTPHIDTGDFVVVINAKKVKLTGDKWEKKNYYRASGYPGGLKEIPAWRMREKKPEEIIRLAVKGMLPKNKSRHIILKKLKVYAGPEHPHQAQKPEPLKI